MLGEGSLPRKIPAGELNFGFDFGETEKNPQKDEIGSLGTSSTSELAPRKGGITYFQTLVSLCKGMVGAGVLSLPLAFKQAGLWMGLFLMILFGFITYYSFKKIVYCAHYLTKKHGFDSLDYGWMAQRAFEKSLPRLRPFATFMRHFVNVCIFAMQLGICSVYVVFVKDHVKELIDYKFPDNSISPVLYYLIEFGFFVGLVMIRNIKIISWVALLGNLIVSTALIIIMQDLIRSDHKIDSLPAVQGIGGVVLSAGSMLYAFEGQAVILPLDNKMKRPSEMLGVFGVLSIGCSLVTFIYVSTGFFGYITYGDDTKASIGLNLSNTGIWFYVKILLILVVYTSYLIQQFVMVDMMWPSIKIKIRDRNYLPSLHLLWEALFKVFLVCLSFGLAISVPNLDDIIPLVGVSAGMLLALVLPALCHMATFLPKWLEDRDFKSMIFHVIIDLTLLITGIFFVISGLISNMQNIIGGK